MNQERFAGICKQFSGTVKEGWGKLIRNPHVVTAGTRDQLAGRMQERYGAAKEQAARQLDDFFARNRKWDLTNR